MPEQIPCKILIVEDDPDIARLLEISLELSGFQPSRVEHGEAALKRLLGKNGFSIALLDIKMPCLNGVEVLKKLQDSNCDVSVIMMSGHGSEDLAVECMKLGAEDYICKPFTLDEMTQRVERVRCHRLALIEKKRLEQEREDFFMMLSHDMKNPMTVVIGSIDIMREGRLGPVNEEQADYLQSAIDSCNEVTMMIDNLLDIRRFELGKMQFSIRRYNPVDMVRKVVSQFSRSAERDLIKLSLDFTGEVSDIAVDRNALIRVLANLLGNSLKFTPEKGEIKVVCEEIDQSDVRIARIPPSVSMPDGFLENKYFVLFSVRDTGSGIQSDQLEFIFDRYTQSSNSSARERGGAGLGLSFCKLAVEKFGGVIWAESTTDNGSEFIILLPCIKD